ncbi:hypothetical protein D3C75_927970 [compost metagenome]
MNQAPLAPGIPVADLVVAVEILHYRQNAGLIFIKQFNRSGLQLPQIDSFNSALPDHLLHLGKMGGNLLHNTLPNLFIKHRDSHCEINR